MALITQRNPETDELESYWDSSFKAAKAVSREALEAGRRIREMAVDNRVIMREIADELGVSSVDISNTFAGLHEITPKMESEYCAAITKVAGARHDD